MGSLFQELKRRNVFKVGAAYAVIAFVLAQVAQLALETFGTPDWVLQTIVLLLGLGFPIALVLAWAYELTPGGIKSDTGVQSAQTSTNSTDRKLIYAILGLVVIGMGFQLADRFNADVDSSIPIAITDSQATSAANASERVRRTIIPLGPMTSSGLTIDLRTSLSLSPDGTRLAYTSFTEGKMQLHVRELNQLQSRPIGPPLDSPNFSSLVFSPDGESLAFFHEGRLKSLALNGGQVQTIAEDTLNVSLDWFTDDALLFVSRNFGVSRVDASSGVVQELITPTLGTDAYFWPRFLPGTNVFLYTRVPNLLRSTESSTAQSVELFDKQTDESRLLIQNAANATYSTTGHLVFIREGSLWAVPFDRENLQIDGTEVKLIDGIDGVDRGGLSIYTLSKNGDLLYLPGEGAEFGVIRNSTVSWVARNGEETPLEMRPQGYESPTLSPDGNQLALIIRLPSLTSDLWNYDLGRGTLSRITFSGSVQSPLWSPTGDRLVFDTPQGIQAINSTGIGSPEVLLAVPNSFFISRRATAFTPDGAGLLYSEMRYGGGLVILTDINQLSLAPEQTTQEVMASEFLTEGGVISPNGRWLAYVTFETGQNEVYLRPWPDVDSNRWPISSGGGSDPQWAADTGELFYRNNTEDGIETWAVSVATEGDFEAGIPELLFTSDHLEKVGASVSSVGGAYSVAANGQRFLMLKPVADEDAEPVAVDTNLVLVDNFAAELRRLVPASTQ